MELEHVNKREETKEEEVGGRRERGENRDDPINRCPYSPSRGARRERCTGARPSVCVSVGPGNPLLARLPPKQGQDPRREWVGAREEGGQRERKREIGGPVRSLYFKQPRTCCNHLETMAHRSVRLAKRPGPDNSRDASSTTLRAILLLRLLRSIASPSAVLSLIFLSPWRIPAPSFEREKES